MDDLDRARHYQDQMTAAAVSHRKPESGLKPKGRCHFCDEPVSQVQLFCDSDCAEDHERMLRHRVGR